MIHIGGIKGAHKQQILHHADIVLESAEGQVADTEDKGHARTILRSIHMANVIYVMAVYALVSLEAAVLRTAWHCFGTLVKSLMSPLHRMYGRPKRSTMRIFAAIVQNFGVGCARAGSLGMAEGFALHWGCALDARLRW